LRYRSFATWRAGEATTRRIEAAYPDRMLQKCRCTLFIDSVAIFFSPRHANPQAELVSVMYQTPELPKASTRYSMNTRTLIGTLRPVG
jgi:hypothetical protein